MAAFVDGVPTGSYQHEQHVDLGPLVGRRRCFKTKERIPFSGGMVGMVMCGDDDVSPRQCLPASPASSILSERSIKGKGRAIDEDGDIEMAEVRDKSVCKTKSMSFSLFVILFQTFFLIRWPNLCTYSP
jgi:uncharacterized protein